MEKVLALRELARLGAVSKEFGLLTESLLRMEKEAWQEVEETEHLLLAAPDREVDKMRRRWLPGVPQRAKYELIDHIRTFRLKAGLSWGEAEKAMSDEISWVQTTKYDPLLVPNSEDEDEEERQEEDHQAEVEEHYRWVQRTGVDCRCAMCWTRPDGVLAEVGWGSDSD